MIEGDFVPKGVGQFNHSSQDPNLEYKKYSLFWEYSVLVVVPIEKRMGE